MLYYRVKPEKEKERFRIPAYAVEPVEVSKRDIYFFFGARYSEEV